jgi:hypothetical protein
MLVSEAVGAALAELGADTAGSCLQAHGRGTRGGRSAGAPAVSRGVGVRSVAVLLRQHPLVLVRVVMVVTWLAGDLAEFGPRL